MEACKRMPGFSFFACGFSEVAACRGARRFGMSTSERPSTGRRFQRRARQEADKQALQTRILETARKEFATGTIETVSIQKIADALGYSKGTVLKYFPTKILLMLAVKQQNLEEVSDRLRRVRARNPNSELRLRRVMDAYIDYW